MALTNPIAIESSSPASLPSPSTFFTQRPTATVSPRFPPSRAISSFTTATALLHSGRFGTTPSPPPPPPPRRAPSVEPLPDSVPTAPSPVKANAPRARQNKGRAKAEKPLPLKKPRVAAPRRGKKKLERSASTILNSDDLAATQFAHLDAVQVQGTEPRKQETTAGSTFLEQAASLNPGEDVVATPVNATRRRLSWTPAKNTATGSAGLQSTTTITLNVSGTPEQPPVSLAAIIRGFEYADQRSTSSPTKRAQSGEVVVKRRRIDLGDPATRAPMLRTRTHSASPAKSKGKASKKKPQTITALATKAYETAEVEAVLSNQATVSTFFAPLQPEVPPETAPEAEAADAPTKAKKPRKPRAKKTDEGSAVKARRTTKIGSKKKARFNDADYSAELYSPSQARAEERQQDFLFGTSSQLAGEECPTFLQEMQLAILQSEGRRAASPTAISLHRTTNLSRGECIEGDNDHWASAARDFSGGVLASDEDIASKQQVAPLPASARALDIAPDTAVEAPPPTTTQPDDFWIVLGSDGTTPEKIGEEIRSPDSPLLVARTAPTAVFPDIAPSIHAPLKPPIPTLKRSETSPIRQRSVLQALDTNVHLLLSPSSPKTVGFLQERPVSMAAPPAAQVRRPGRPKKIAESTTSSVPPKQKKPDTGYHSPQSRFVRAGQAASPHVASPCAITIEDISDNEPPATPSPPRRRANSTPPAIRPLDFDIVTFTSTVANDRAPVSKVKFDNPGWPAIMAQVFPQITKTIRSTPPSTDMANPTWHEKILLYDPIVLEDLTAWLNGRGVRIQRREEVKTKSKTKKPSKVASATSYESLANEIKYSTVQEELMPWMVQKWCEERSICCLWKEGLRGGVRTRY